VFILFMLSVFLIPLMLVNKDYHYCTFRLEAADDAQNVRVDTARGKDNDQQHLSKMIM